MSELSVDAGAALRKMKITVKLTGLRRMRFRLWAGCKLLRLATDVMGCQGEVFLNGEPL